jgi:hypothetical protein
MKRDIPPKGRSITARILTMLVLSILGMSSQATPIVTVSSPNNLNALHVGDTVRFDVNVAGPLDYSNMDLTLFFGIPNFFHDWTPQGFDLGSGSGICLAPCIGVGEYSGGVRYVSIASVLPPTVDYDFFYTATVSAPGSEYISVLGAESGYSPINGAYFIVPLSRALAGVEATTRESVPEPATLALLGLGVASMGWVKRRKG